MEINHSTTIGYFQYDPRNFRVFQIVAVMIVLIMMAYKQTSMMIGIITLLSISFISIGEQSAYGYKLDKLIRSRLDQELSNALKEHGIINQNLIAEPVMFWGWDLASEHSPRELVDRVVEIEKLRDLLGPDGQWRSPSAIISTLLFTDSKILSLKKYMSVVSLAKMERANEIDYRSITDVSTHIEELKARNKKGEPIVKQRHMVSIHTENEPYGFAVRNEEEAQRVKNEIVAIWKQEES